MPVDNPIPKMEVFTASGSQVEAIYLANAYALVSAQLEIQKDGHYCVLLMSADTGRGALLTGLSYRENGVAGSTNAMIGQYICKGYGGRFKVLSEGEFTFQYTVAAQAGAPIYGEGD